MKSNTLLRTATRLAWCVSIAVASAPLLPAAGAERGRLALHVPLKAERVGRGVPASGSGAVVERGDELFLMPADPATADLVQLEEPPLDEFPSPAQQWTSVSSGVKLPEAAYGSIVTGVPLTFDMSERDGALQITNIRPATLNFWALQETRFSSSDYHALHSAFSDYEAVFQDVSHASRTDQEALTRLRASCDLVERALVQSYARLSVADPGSPEVPTIVSLYEENGKVKKALYDLDDRYAPETYRQIFKNTQGTGMVKSSSAGPEGSGVLVATNLFLTCAHCVYQYVPDRLTNVSVVFGYEKGLKDQILPTNEFPVTSILAEGGSFAEGSPYVLDFYLLELGKNKDGQNAGDLFGPQFLSERRAKLDDPIYVVGHPRGKYKAVHDNARVMFPFTVTAYEFSELQLRIAQEFQGATDQVEKVNSFTSSYVPTKEGNIIIYRNYEYRGLPSIGADCDTFRGNSGSPVYNKRGKGVIGLLMSGEDDRMTYHAGWRYHEVVLPMSMIVKQLKQHPAWKSLGIATVD